MACGDFPDKTTGETLLKDATTINEIVTSPDDLTNPASDGKQKTTLTGIDTLAEEQREQFEKTFSSQFSYKRIGNISGYVGDSLTDSEKLNSYQYPDDSGDWYGPIQSQSFPITIPSDPSSDNGWALVHGTGSQKTYTFVFEGDSITEGNTIGGYKYSDVFSNLSFAKGKGPTYNFAVGGSFVWDGSPSLNERYTSLVKPLRPNANGGTGGDVSYLFIMAGTNDLDTRYGNRNATEIIQDLTNYTQRAMNDGFTVVLQTILPRESNQNGWDVQTEQWRLDINANIRRRSIPSDIVSDTESFVNDVTSGFMFGDGIHPSQAGADMIAIYLNSVMTADGSLEMGNVLSSRPLQGLFDSKDKTMVRVGSEYMKTSLGTTYNENKNGFFVMENLNPSKADSSLWMAELGVNGDYLRWLAPGDGLSGGNPVISFGRDGLRTWVEAGNVGQKTIIGTPSSDADSAPIYMVNLAATGVGTDESTWAWVAGASTDPRPSSLRLDAVSDDLTSRNLAIEFKRTGQDFTSMALSGTISTDGSTPSFPWHFGGVKANPNNNNAINVTEYVEVEIAGQTVRLAVINDPVPS